jgi:NhaP-type Na+/H+ or K+/H+ antiporter
MFSAGDESDDLANKTISFSSNIFFMALLPPILFNSGYELQIELFYRHIKPITLFAALGTNISGFATGFALYGVNLLGWFGYFDLTPLELLTFGALIATTDTSVRVLGVLQKQRA